MTGAGVTADHRCTALEAEELVRVSVQESVCVQMCLEVEEKMKKGPRKSRSKPRLVLISSAGHNPHEVTSMVLILRF